jgi:hypothetical protein
VSGDIACEDAEAFLPLVADGALQPEDDPALFAHLASCACCQESLARHDLVSLALAPATRAPRLARLQLPLPWAVATAAGIGCAASMCWNALADPRWSVPRQVGHVAAISAPDPAPAPPPVLRPHELLPRGGAPGPGLDGATLAADERSVAVPTIITLGEDADGGGTYILLQDGRSAFIPIQRERAPAGGLAHQVSLNRY